MRKGGGRRRWRNEDSNSPSRQCLKKGIHSKTRQRRIPTEGVNAQKKLPFHPAVNDSERALMGGGSKRKEKKRIPNPQLQMERKSKLSITSRSAASVRSKGSKRSGGGFHSFFPSVAALFPLSFVSNETGTPEVGAGAGGKNP